MKSLLDLQAGECRFPHGDAPHLFCAEPTMEGESYCRQHQKLCYGAALPRARRFLSPGFDLVTVLPLGPPPEPMRDLIDTWRQNEDDVKLGSTPEQE